MKRRTKFWLKLVGSRSTFSLESRIFHSISIGIVVLAGLYIPYNIFAGMYVAAASACLLSALFYYQYYGSRFNRSPHNSVVFGIAGILIFGVNYFCNSGINGSTDLIWPVYLLVVLAISPYRQHLWWLVVYMLCFFLLHAVEFYHPSSISYPFTAGKGQFIDRITAFPIPVITIYLIIKFVRRSYDRERKATEEKTEAIEKLMSIISHDLRTPLINIQNYLELLNADDVEGSEGAEIHRALLKSTNNAMQMLNNLLHWSKSQMDGSTANLVTLNLCDGLQSTLQMEKGHALKKGIQMDYHLPADVFVLADVDMLQLVVRNLISNAVKFTQREGRIQVHAELSGEECRIMVKDNGRGIPIEKQESVFSIQSESSYGTNNEKGVGLGLLLCKEFIERQGGRIGFESMPGLGSCFFIMLPVVKESEAEQ